MSFDSIHHGFQKINQLSQIMIQQPALSSIEVSLPAPGSGSELAFIRATSWLYCLYFEAGRGSISFLIKLAEAYQLDQVSQYKSHMENIRCLRTEFHHNLGFEGTDYQARTKAEEWRYQACGTRIPADGNDWKKCYQRLVKDEAVKFLDFLERTLRYLEQDAAESRERNIMDWRQRLQQDYPAARFDPLIEDIKFQLGKKGLDTVKFRNRYVGRWKKELEIMQEDYDFNYEASRLIESALINDSQSALPFSSTELMDYFNLPQGPDVGEYLKIANIIYKSGIVDKQQLLREVGNRISNGD